MRRKWRLYRRTTELMSLFATLCRHGLGEWRLQRVSADEIGMVPYSRLVNDGGAFYALLRGVGA